MYSSAQRTLDRLREGNRQFVSGTWHGATLASPARRTALLAGQHPFAIILGCSDSRVPSEIIFGQGLGDLFVIRVAGNIVAPSQIASVEFAANHFGTRLVVVLGHSRCGAVSATIESLLQPEKPASPSLSCILDRVRPAVEPLFATNLKNDPDALLQQAVRANVRSSVEQLRAGSEVLRRLIESDGLVVAGAEYSLETGVVDFFHGAAELGSNGKVQHADP